MLTYEELISVFRACRDMRQQLVLTMLYDTGIRVSELLRIRLADFNKTHRSITIHNSKGQNIRVVQYRGSIRRFCLHILPSGFRKVRHYGFTSNASKAKSLNKARLALGQRIGILPARNER